MSMINFMLPGAYEQFPLNKAVIEFYHTHPQYFIENFNIGACFGNFHFTIWDGGRTFVEYHPASYEQIIEVRDFYKKFNIPLRFVYTNPVLEPVHLTDRFNNLVTSLCEDENNEIVVNSDILEDYLRIQYPKYKFISSTTKCLSKTSESAEELKKDYYLVCLDYNLNKNYKYLESIPDEDKKKVEFLVNAICPPGCPNRKHHYFLNGIEHLSYNRKYFIDCAIKEGLNHPDTINYKTTITLEDIYNYYLPHGFNNFKIEGRTVSPGELICTYARLFIKPEYQFDFISKISYATQENHNNFYQGRVPFKI